MINLPNFTEEWLTENDMSKILFLYAFIRINQFHLDGHYEFRVLDYLSTLYSSSSIKSKSIKLIESLNAIFIKLIKYKMINTDILIENKSDVINLEYKNVTNEFEDGTYTLIDYSVFRAICNTDSDIEKDKLFYCCLFLNNRARNSLGYTSFEDISKILGSKTTTSKYLSWFKDNKIFDYYSTNHKLDENGIPKRGNTIVAKWENKNLIDKIRGNDIPSTNSKEDIENLDYMFADDTFYNKLSEVLRGKYGLVNNFLLLRLHNELPYGFTWKAIYKYLNASKNVEFFITNEEDVFETNATKMLNKIVNIAKKQEADVMQYDEDADKSELIGRAYKKENSSNCTFNSDENNKKVS